MRKTALLILLPLTTCARPEPGPDGELSITLLDDATGRPTPGVVRISDERGAPVPLPALLPRGLGIDPKVAIGRWSVLPAPATLRVPRGRLAVEAFRGLDTLLARAEVDLSAEPRASVRLALRRFAGAGGQRGGNTHLHLMKVTRDQSDRYLREVPGADGLDLVFLSYLERAVDDATYVSNRYTDDDLRELSKGGVLFANGEEHRHNFKPYGEGYGHVMFLDIRKLILPVSIGPGIMARGTDGIPLRRGIEEARRDGATVVWCHNTFGYEDIPNWVAGRVHAQNIFDGGEHGTYKDTFYRYLNAGLKVPFSTGTDWFIYDLSRAYVPVEGPFTAHAWLRALREGNSTITNGPLLEFEAAGQRPGGTARLPGPGRVKVRARGAGRIDFGKLEIVRNGKVVHEIPRASRAGYFEAAGEPEIEVPEPSWLALRIPPDGVPENEYGKPLFAHTSPVYVEVGGKPVFLRAEAEGLLDEVRRSRETVASTALFADDHERGHVLAVYDDAIRALERTLAR